MPIDRSTFQAAWVQPYLDAVPGYPSAIAERQRLIPPRLTDGAGAGVDLAEILS